MDKEGAADIAIEALDKAAERLNLSNMKLTILEQKARIAELEAELEGMKKQEPRHYEDQYGNIEQVVPEKIKPATRTLESVGYANGWNDCIEAMLSAAPKENT